MNILVTGGAGYIGIHVARAFREQGAHVEILDDYSSGSRINTEHAFRVHQGSILDRSFLADVFSKPWDGVVHLAAFKAAGESMTRPELYARNNISGTISLLEALCTSPCRALVFSSSAAIFGTPKYLPIDEDHPKNPVNFYGFTKLNMEQILNWYSTLKGLHFASLRYFNAAGYDPGGTITEPERNPQNLVPVLMEAALGIRPSVTVFGSDYDTPDGTCIRDYVHVTDLARAHVLSMQYLLEHKTNLELNLGSGTGFSVTHMVNKTRDITGVHFPVLDGDRRPGDPRELVASSARAESLLGWKPLRSSVHHILEDTWSLYKKAART